MASGVLITGSLSWTRTVVRTLTRVRERAGAWICQSTVIWPRPAPRDFSISSFFSPGMKPAQTPRV